MVSVTLTEDQKSLYDKVVHNRTNILITGKSTYGKAYILQVMIDGIKSKYGVSDENIHYISTVDGLLGITSDTNLIVLGNMSLNVSKDIDSISDRASEVTKCEMPFGGIHVIAVDHSFSSVYTKSSAWNALTFYHTQLPLVAADTLGQDTTVSIRLTCF